MAWFTLPEKLGMRFLDATDWAAISNLAAPTVAELTDTGSIDLIGVANGEAMITEAVSGFNVTSSQIEVSTYVSSTIGKIPGPSSVDDIKIEFVRDDTTQAVYDGVSEGETGGIALFIGDQTVTAGFTVDMWPVTIQQKNNKFTGANEAAKWILDVAAGIPTKDGTIAA